MEGDIIKNQLSVRRTLRDYENGTLLSSELFAADLYDTVYYKHENPKLTKNLKTILWQKTADFTCRKVLRQTLLVCHSAIFKGRALSVFVICLRMKCGSIRAIPLKMFGVWMAAFNFWTTPTAISIILGVPPPKSEIISDHPLQIF